MVATITIAVVAVIALIAAERLRGPDPSTGRLIGHALAALGVTGVVWLVLATVTDPPSGGVASGLSGFITGMSVFYVVRGKRTTHAVPRHG